MGVGVAIMRVLSIDEKGTCCPVILMPKDSEARFSHVTTELSYTVTL
jgi:hypothetical protein